jgi:transposase
MSWMASKFSEQFSAHSWSMPLSVAALISGMMTLIASSPNMIIESELRGHGLAPLDFFSWTPFGELRKDGIEMVAPHRSNRRKRATQDGRRLRRYARRWLVERFFAWIQWQRRILVRWEFYPKNFLASCNSSASSSSSNDFEIGSSQGCYHSPCSQKRGAF